MDRMPRPEYHLAIEPRGLSILQAAMYVGVSPSLFVALMRAGKMPRPKVMGVHRIWDRNALDASFDELPDEFGLPEDAAPPSGGVQGDGSRAFPIVIPPATEEQIAAVRLRMDMQRYGQSTEGMTDAQIDKLGEQHYERWRKKVIASPLDKREMAALPQLYEGRDRVFRHGEIKGAGWTTEDRLEVRGYVKLHKMNDLTVSWQITDAGIKAFESGAAG